MHLSFKQICHAGHLDGRENGCASLRPMFEMNSLKSAVMLKSGLHCASENVVNMSNSMFQTGSGKTVNISSAGLLRAKTLLGLAENYDQEQTQKQSTSMELLALENPSHLETQGPNNLSFSSSTKVLTSSRVKSGFHGSESMKFLDCMNTAPEPPPVKFHTAGGRSISVSGDALQRARSLLGNPEFDSFLNEASTADPRFPIIDDGKPSCSSNQKNDFSTPFLHRGIENGDCSSRNFTSPPRSSSYKKQSFGKSERLQPGNNLITQFDAEAAINTSNRPYTGLTGNREPPKNNTYSEKMDSLENAVRLKMDPSKRPSSGALVDISNTMNIDHLDNKQYFGEKRRLRRISSVSSFKKPRSSFVTPLNKNNSSDINGKVSSFEHKLRASQNLSSAILRHVLLLVLSRLAPKETSSKQRVSLRYPLQVPRAYLKEYVLQPPSLQEKV